MRAREKIRTAKRSFFRSQGSFEEEGIGWVIIGSGGGWEGGCRRRIRMLSVRAVAMSRREMRGRSKNRRGLRDGETGASSEGRDAESSKGVEEEVMRM